MLNRLLEFSLRQRVFILLGMVALAVAGILSAVRLPIDAVPDVTNVQVQINTTIAALAAEEIEKQVTFPIETEMQGLQGLVELRSISRFGLSQVTLVFDEETDEGLEQALAELKRLRFDPATLRRHALTFDRPVFSARLTSLMTDALQAFQNRRESPQAWKKMEGLVERDRVGA